MAPPALISVVDDDESIRDSLPGLIRAVGFSSRAFASAEEFLTSDQLPETDCLILDVRMPGMNGLDLQQRLLVSHPSLPIIFISAHGDDETRARVLRDGAVDCLLKPFSEDALLSAIHRALRARGSGGESEA